MSSPPGLRSVGRGKVSLRLGHQPSSPREFSPLTPPRAAHLDLEGLGADLLESFSFDGDVELRAGSYDLPLFPTEELAIKVPSGARCRVRAQASAPEGELGTARLSGVELLFDPPLVLDKILPVLASLPSLFEDRGLARVRSWLAESLPGAGAAAARWGRLREALLGRTRPALEDAAAAVRIWSGELALVHLRRAVLDAVKRGDEWRLEPRFSGHFYVAGRTPIPFEGVHLPPQILPELHADLASLLSGSPLATATLLTERLRTFALADGLAEMVAGLRGKMRLVGALPAVAMEVLLPDQGTLLASLRSADQLSVEADFEVEVGPDRLFLRVPRAEVGAGGQRLAFEAEVVVERDSVVEPAGIPTQALRAAEAGRWPPGLALEVKARLEPGSSLPAAVLEARVRHEQLKGGIDVVARATDLAVSGAAALSIPAGLEPEPQVRAELEFSAALELLEGSRFDDGHSAADVAGTSTTLSGRVRIDEDGPVQAEVMADADLNVHGRREMGAFPELNIEAAPLELVARGTAHLEAKVEAREREGHLLEVDFSGTGARLRLDRLEARLGDRVLTLPPRSQVALTVREAVLAASGLGRAAIEVGWDLQGESPILRDETQVVELFVPSLRRRSMQIQLSPAGGLTISGEEGDLYDARFFNALLNPGADPDRLLAILENEEAMDRVAAAVRVFSEDLHRVLEAARRFARRGRDALDAEGVRRPGDMIPARKIARVLSRVLCGSLDLEDRAYGLVKQVTDGKGLDVRATKRLIDDSLGDHDYGFEVDRGVRWVAHLLAPTEPLPPFEVEELPPLEMDPQYRRALEGLPSAAEIYAALDADAPLPASLSERLARCAPYLAFEQVQYVVGRGRDDWREEDHNRLLHVLELKRRVRMIAESYGGLESTPQAMAIAFFLGETIAMSEDDRRRRPAPPDFPLADTLLGPEDAAVLLQAGLAAVLQGRTVQLNQRMLLDHALAQQPDYLRAILVELSGRSPSVLAGVLNALLNLEQSCVREPLDLVAVLSEKLDVELPRLSDFLAGGRSASLSYFDALHRASEKILADAQEVLARKCHLQLQRHPPSPGHESSPETAALEHQARDAVAHADRVARACSFEGEPSGPLTEARAAYEAAFTACAELIAAAPEAFQDEWLRGFWERNYEALMVLSVVRNVQEDIDDVRRWLEIRTGELPLEKEQALVETVIAALYYRPEDRLRLSADPLVRLLVEPPPGRYDFTVISAMGVVTEGAEGRELESAYRRLEERRGVRVIRADTATARSLEYNAARIEDGVRRVTTPWGYIGYSQGCANGLMAESRLLAGTPEQQALARGLRTRNLLFSAFNGSAHGTCGDWKFLRAVVEGEQILKHYQAVFSHRVTQVALMALRLFLDSRPFVHSMLGTGSLSHHGLRFHHREGQYKGDAPTCYIRGVVETETLPEALEWLANVLETQIESTEHDTQVAAAEAVGHPVWVRNPEAEKLMRCAIGSMVQRTHHWSPLLHETEFITTERDRAMGIYDFPKDRHVFPWIELNARFGIIQRQGAPHKG